MEAVWLQKRQQLEAPPWFWLLSFNVHLSAGTVGPETEGPKHTSASRTGAERSCMKTIQTVQIQRIYDSSEGSGAGHPSETQQNESVTAGPSSVPLPGETSIQHKCVK